MILSYILLLYSAVHTYGGWFSSEPEYARWSNTELRTWLEHRNIKVPSSFDRSHLFDLVDSNWYQQSPFSARDESGRQWSFDQYKQVWQAFEHVKDQSLDKWDDSRLKSFLLEQGIVAPSNSREQLILLAKNKYHACSDAAALYSSLLSTTISSAHASASDGTHSAFQRHSTLNSAVWEFWSDSYVREWLITHKILKPTDTLSRSSLLSEMQKYYYNCTENVWNTWTDSELKAWLVDHGFLRSDSKQNRNEMIAMVEKHYLSALEVIWGAWADSDIRHWLLEHGYVESDNHLNSRKDLLEMINISYPDASAKVPSYLVWPDARLRAFLRERGISETALPTNRAGLLHEVRIHWLQTSAKAENVLAKLKGVIHSSIETMEDKISRVLEVLSGHSHDTVCHVSEETQQFARP